MWTGILDNLLNRLVQEGTLHMTFPDGHERHYGAGQPEVRMTIKDPTLPARLVRNAELALGEGYMNGGIEVEDDDLHAMFALFMTNLRKGNSHWALRMSEGFYKAVRRVLQYNPVGKAQANVAHHYDLSGELYDLFLDDDLQYSCAYYRSPDDTLEAAQAQKKAHIARKLLLKPGMRVLDVGCGWGGLGLTLARDYGVEVVGVTLSREQHKIANERARAEGLADKVEFRLQDYREVDDTFDRIVSVGMFEHVGVPQYREFFRHVREKLTDDGVALIHTIGRSEPPGATSPWTVKYIFPGGYIPAMSETLSALEKERLVTDDIEVWRLHYAMTLRAWHDRFAAQRDAAIALYDERFYRMWRYWLVSSEMAFRSGRLVVFHFQLSRDQAAVPLTRDYLYDAPRREADRQAAE